MSGVDRTFKSHNDDLMIEIRNYNGFQILTPCIIMASEASHKNDDKN